MNIILSNTTLVVNDQGLRSCIHRNHIHLRYSPFPRQRVFLVVPVRSIVQAPGKRKLVRIWRFYDFFDSVSFNIHGKTISQIDGCRPLKIVKQPNIHTFMTVSTWYFWGNPFKNPPVGGCWVAHGPSRCGASFRWMCISGLRTWSYSNRSRIWLIGSTSSNLQKAKMKLS